MSSSSSSSSSSPSSFSSKIVELVIIPLILLSGLLVLLYQNPKSTDYNSFLSSYHPVFTAKDAYHTPVPVPVPASAPPVKEEKAPGINYKEIARINKIPSSRSNLHLIEASLTRARATIHKSKTEDDNNRTSYDPEYVPTGPVYRNPKAFHRSYLEMEKLFKIYVYSDGEPPLFHYSKSQGILGIEGIIIHHIEMSKFRTNNPKKAHVYFIPLSVQSIVDFAYNHSRAWSPWQDIAKDYINLISTKYPYWNRTLGRDHFFVACHDWAPTISKGVPNLFKNSIRVLCNANTSEGFKPSIDVSMPEIYLPDGTMNGLTGGPPPSERSILVFYAGGIHGDIRKLLMDQWRNKDPDVQIYEYLPKKVSYYGMLRKSKYCICPSGYEVASPRMVEALYMGCVPVLLKDHYAKPFDDVLDWSKFSIEVQVKEISNLKKILMSVSLKRYVQMQKMGIQVRRHFEVYFPPKRYDVFHMILHSIWLRRLNIQLHDT